VRGYIVTDSSGRVIATHVWGGPVKEMPTHNPLAVPTGGRAYETNDEILVQEVTSYMSDNQSVKIVNRRSEIKLEIAGREQSISRPIRER